MRKNSIHSRTGLAFFVVFCIGRIGFSPVGVETAIGQTYPGGPGGGGPSSTNDHDQDGILNRFDNCATDANPDQEDLDEDGRGDVCDNCPADPSNGQQDEDQDGVGDVCDLCPGIDNGMDLDGDCVEDAFDADADGDGFFKGADPATGQALPGPTDCDDLEELNNPIAPEVCIDGVDNDCDGLTDEADPECDCAETDPDSDGDGLCDKIDNCPDVANPDQLDSDGGRYLGDACDPDDDNDRVLDENDNCPKTANRFQADTDGDGLGDACDDDDDDDGVADGDDNCPFTTNADQIDADGDGIGDACGDQFDNAFSFFALDFILAFLRMLGFNI